jgi:hypothetical protein
MPDSLVPRTVRFDPKLRSFGNRLVVVLAGAPYPVFRFTFVRHGYPWIPTDQAHGRPRQVGPAYQKTRRPVSGLNRPSW